MSRRSPTYEDDQTLPAPSFVQAGTGAVWQSGGAVAVAITATAGNFLILQVLADGNDTVTLSSISGIANLAGTANSVTTIVQYAGTIDIDLYCGIATSTSVSASMASAGVDLYARWWEFSGVRSGSALADVLENVTPGATTSDAATSATIADASVTSMGPLRLALNFIGVNDDNEATFDTEAFTGQTGGTWVSGGSYGSATGTDGSIGLQYATLDGAIAINGGSLSMGVSDSWATIGFALRPPEVPNINYPILVTA